MENKTRLSIVDYFTRAKEALDQDDLEKADELLDWCLLILSKKTLAGLSGNKYLEGTKMNVWYERVWTTIEKAGLLPD
jgi:hypothetical protein